MWKRDNLFLVLFIVAFVLWLYFASRVPPNWTWLYLTGLVFLAIPFLYVVYLKKTVYQWSGEAILYLFLLPFGGIVAFSNSILGLKPFETVMILYLSTLKFLGS